MEGKKSFQWIIIALLSTAIVVMSVGFAAFSSQLTVNGTATAKGNPWSVHFDAASYSDTGSNVTVTPTLGNTSITYDVTLTKPGDKYTFTINVVNDGTIDAYLKGITIGGPSSTNDAYLNYTVTYDGTTYAASNSTLSILLAKNNGTAPLTVTVEYDPTLTQEQLPATDIEQSLSVSLDYSDAA